MLTSTLNGRLWNRALWTATISLGCHWIFLLFAPPPQTGVLNILYLITAGTVVLSLILFVVLSVLAGIGCIDLYKKDGYTIAPLPPIRNKPFAPRRRRCANAKR